MVEISEIIDEDIPASEERLLDAQEIERAAATLERPTAKMQLEALAKKMRKESEALKRMEASRAKVEKPEEEAVIVEDVTKEKAPPASSAPVAAATPAPATTPAPHIVPPSAKYVPISSFAFDSGKFNSATVSVYVTLDGVKTDTARENITCDFTPSSFDFIVRDLRGKSYRLFKDNLAHDINPATSKIVVKVDRVIIRLGKCKGEYGYDSWTDLVDKKGKGSSAAAASRDADGKRKKDDPQASIMNMMKDMYESGDDNMRKIIGETMEKQRRGDLGQGKSPLDSMGM